MTDPLLDPLLEWCQTVNSFTQVNQEPKQIIKPIASHTESSREKDPEFERSLFVNSPAEQSQKAEAKKGYVVEAVRSSNN